MWIAKGTLLGVWLLSFGTIAYFVFFLGIKPNHSTTIDVRGLTFFTISNPSWWLWFVACLALGLIVARLWPGRGVFGSIVWVGLAITELFPLGLLVLILVLVGR